MIYVSGESLRVCVFLKTSGLHKDWGPGIYITFIQTSGRDRVVLFDVSYRNGTIKFEQLFYLDLNIMFKTFLSFLFPPLQLSVTLLTGRARRSRCPHPQTQLQCPILGPPQGLDPLLDQFWGLVQDQDHPQVQSTA